jgi:transcription initiation factor TFIIIB Brf1 subunit/transcription initiation factor TFIIB
MYNVMTTKYDEDYFVDDDEVCEAFSQFRNIGRPSHHGVCPNCGGKKSINEENGLICKDCGAFIHEETAIDCSPEWNNNDEKNLTRCNFSINPLLPRASMTTMVVNNKNLPEPLRKMHRWSAYSYRETSLFKTFGKISSLCQENGINKAVIDDANRIYTMVSEKQIRRGDSRIGMMGACIYYGCKKRGVYKTEEDIAKILKINTERITKAYDALTEFMFKHGQISDSEITSPDIKGYAMLYSEKLRIKPVFKEKIVKLADYVNTHASGLKNMPSSLATGIVYSIYVEAHNGRGNSDYRKKLAKLAGLSDITVGKAYNSINSLKK